MVYFYIASFILFAKSGCLRINPVRRSCCFCCSALCFGKVSLVYRRCVSVVLRVPVSPRLGSASQAGHRRLPLSFSFASSLLCCWERSRGDFGQFRCGTGNRYFWYCCRVVVLYLTIQACLVRPACYCWELRQTFTGPCRRARLSLGKLWLPFVNRVAFLIAFSIVLLSRFISDSPPARSESANFTSQY